MPFPFPIRTPSARSRTGVPPAAVRGRAGLSLSLFFCALACGVHAAPAKPSKKAVSKAMNADPQMLTQLAAFLRDYHHAVQTADRAFLTAHTTLPLPFAEGVYDMEAKARAGKITTVDQLLSAKEALLWPEVLLAKDGAELKKLRRGTQKCGDPKAPEVPDWTQGEPALQLHGDKEALLTYLNYPCESETHLVTLVFLRSDTGWKLHERTVRMGAK